MATLTFDHNDLDYIVHEMEDYGIPADKLEQVQQRIINTMTNPEYWHYEIQHFSEGMEG